jgi:hypothetical protein
VVVQVADAGGDALHPLEGFLGLQSVGIAADDLLQRLARRVLHDDPGIVVLVLLNVVQRDEVGVFQVQALGDAAQLDVEVVAHQLQGDFLAAVADGEVDLAEAAAADAPLDGVAVERP